MSVITITGKLKYIFIVLIFVAGFAGYILYNDSRNSVPKAEAAIVDNFLLGFAWSPNIGWISFNSSNCDTDNNTFIDLGTCGGNNNTTPVTNYSVNADIESSGELSGYAWSPNIGWISFNKADTGIPPAAPYNVGFEIYTAKLDGSNNLTGWARALSYGGGWDGWIKLRKDPYVAPLYGVKLVGSDFEGFAWGDTVVGWISFNSKNCDTDNNTFIDSGACGGNNNNTTPVTNYKVHLSGFPYATDFIGPNPSYCNKPAQFSLAWTYRNINGVDQDQYHIQVATDNLFSVASIVLDTTKSESVAVGNPGSAMLRVVPAVIDLLTDILYNNTYFLRLQVRATDGTLSGWINYNDVSDPDGNGVTDSFKTPTHEYPDVGFTPPDPSAFLVNTQIDFKATMNPNPLSKLYYNSVCYKASDNSPEDCKSWIWTFDGVSEPQIIGSNGDTAHSFPLSGPHIIILTVEDNDGKTCSNPAGSKSLGSLQARWVEVVPNN